MKKVLLLLFVFVLSFTFCLFLKANTNKTISLDDYLKEDKNNIELKLNKNGDVIFKNRVVLTQKSVPLNENTATTTLELKILFKASGVNPNKNCDPQDVSKNGSLGCYLDNPDE